MRSRVADRGRTEIQALSPASTTDTSAARMRKPPRTPPLLGERRHGRRSRRKSEALLEDIFPIQGRTSRKPDLANSVVPGGPPPPTPLNLAARSGPFSHVRVVPEPPVEENLDLRPQRSNPFTFKKPSFSEEVEANLSSHPNPYNWQANLANASDGSSFAQKARAAELNAARARRAAQMQSIDDEIPNLSGPVSLGTYKFTRRDRGKRYETHRLSELQEDQEKKGENKVTKPATTSSASAYPHSCPQSPTTLPSSHFSNRPAHQTEAEYSDRIPDRLNNQSPDNRGFHEPGPPQFDQFDLSHFAANLPDSHHSIYAVRRDYQASARVKSSLLPAQLYGLSQESSAFIKPDTLSSETSEQVPPSPSPKYHGPNQPFNATINPDSETPQPVPRQADISFQIQGQSSSQNFNVSINPDRNRPQSASKQADKSFLIEDHSSTRKLNASITLDRITLQPASKEADSSFGIQDQSSNQNFNVSINLDRNRPHLASSQADSSSLIQDHSSHQNFNASIIADRQSLGASGQIHTSFPLADRRLDTSQQYGQSADSLIDSTKVDGQSSRATLPLSDTLPTASFNLETNQWDPDLPETSMTFQTPTNKSARGGHSSHTSSRPSSSRMSNPTHNVLNPYAILTTTKSGRPYTNPWVPIDPPPPTLRQNVRESPSGHTSLDTQRDDAELVERQRKTRYVDQEEARYRALEEAKFGHPEGSPDDPFRDQTAQIQQYGRNQPPSYSEYAAHYGVYGQLSDHGDHPTPTAYTSIPNASPLHAPIAGMSPYHGQSSTYEQETVLNHRDQNPGAAPYEQRSTSMLNNPRPPVRLPAVRGTEQPKPFPQEPIFASLSIEDNTGKHAQDQRRRHTQNGVQTGPSRVSHAVPIRDPAAYTGSGLTTRRNQEVLKQNLDSIVASTQGPTGSARTVMNDPQRDRQPTSRPSSAVTDTTITGSTLRAQAPSYESTTIQRPPIPVQSRTGDTLNNPERTAADSESIYRHEYFRAPVTPSGFGVDAAAYTNNAGLPAAAIGAGNKFMNELVGKPPSKQNSQQRLEDATTWFRTDPRDLSYAAAILPYETMNKMNAGQFPIEDITRRTIGELSDESQDDDPSDQTRQGATPRPIGHGRPAGFSTPPSNHGPRWTTTQPPFSTLADVPSINDQESMKRSGQKFLEEDARAIEAMFGGVYSNLMAGKNGPYDYLNHYCPPPAYAIDHNAKNNDTFFDPQWFATAPPARVGRDPRREQGEYEDPTQGNASRRGDIVRRDSGGGRAWGRN